MSVVELDEENSGSLSDSRAPCNSRYANNFRDRLPKVASFDSRSILVSTVKRCRFFGKEDRFERECSRFGK